MNLEIKTYDEMVKDYGGIFTLTDGRTEYIHEVGFVGLCKEFCDDLVETLKGKNVLGVMSGKGSIERVLVDNGIDAIATDSKAWAEGKQYAGWRDEFVPVEKISGLDAIEKYKDWADIVIMAWPYMDSDAYEIAKKLKDLNIPLLYIGEDWGGCTANDEFFEFIANYKTIPVGDIYYRFPGIHDFPMIIYWEPETDEE